MNKANFLAILYIGTILPGLYLISESQGRGILGLMILNIIGLILWTIIFKEKKSGSSFVSPGFWAVIALIIASIIGRNLWSPSDRLYEQTLAPQTTSFSSGDTTDIGSGGVIFGSGDTAGLSGLNFSGDIMTGSDSMIISGADSATIQDPLPEYERPTVETNTPEQAPTSPQLSLPSGQLTYASVIPHLVSTYNLTLRGSDSYRFTNISPSNSLYPSFRIAASRNMIGTNLNPNSIVSCNTYLVLKGIAAGRDVTYPAGSPFAAYRAEAVRRGVVNGCTDGGFVTRERL